MIKTPTEPPDDPTHQPAPLVDPGDYPDPGEATPDLPDPPDSPAPGERVEGVLSNLDLAYEAWRERHAGTDTYPPPLAAVPLFDPRDRRDPG